MKLSYIECGGTLCLLYLSFCYILQLPKFVHGNSESVVNTKKRDNVNRDVNDSESSVKGGLSWHNLGVSKAKTILSKKPPEYILRPSSGFIPKSHLCGIIGPSGMCNHPIINHKEKTTKIVKK